VLIGKKLKDGLVEFITRRGLEKEEVSVNDIIDLVTKRV
jgi:prolyl-tRNA synthetase